MGKNIIDRFFEELDAYIKILEREYTKYKKLYDVNQFLRKNFSSADKDVYGSFIRLTKASCNEKGIAFNENRIFEVAAQEVYELLNFLEPKSNITFEQLSEAFTTCFLAEKNEVMKKYERYNSSIKLLLSVKQLLVRHQFRKSENNRLSVEQLESSLAKYRNLLRFLLTGELSQELDDVSSYYVRAAGFTDDEWLEIYNYILMTQLRSYMNEEEERREQVRVEVERELDDKARELEGKIFDSLPRESAELLKPTDNSMELEEVGEETEEYVEDEELSPITDINLLNQFNALTDKVHTHRVLARISPTKEQSFRAVYESLNSGYSLEYVQGVYQPSDYVRFLYYCFVREYEVIKSDMETYYPVSELDEFTELLVDEINKPIYYLRELEKVLEAEEKEREKLNSEDVELEEESEYKLVFLDDGNGAFEIYKDVKRFTPEKMQDLANILTKMEEGRLEASMTVSKNIPIAFKSIRGKYIFVLYRVLSDGHLLICKVNNLDEFDATIDRSNYGSQRETEINAIIRDNGLKYNQLMEKQKVVKSTLFGPGYTKGV